MLGRGVVAIRVGGLSVNFKVWVAEVQNPCILGLDFLWFAHGMLDLEKNTLSWGSHGQNSALHTGLKSTTSDPESGRDTSWAGPPLLSLATPHLRPQSPMTAQGPLH